MNKGDRALFSGVLLADSALARIISDYEAKLKLANAKLEKLRRDAVANSTTAKAVYDAKLKSSKDTLAVIQGGCTKQATILEKALQACEDRKGSVFRSPYFNFLVGNVVAGGLCALATFGSRQ